jgi:hypothetical protein
MPSVINLSDQTWASDDFGSDINQLVEFKFLKTSLQEISLVPEVGDIILYFNNFYEVDSRIENQYILGKDPNYNLSIGTNNKGDSFSVIISAHISRVEKLNLIPLREGKYPSLTKFNDGTANS